MMGQRIGALRPTALFLLLLLSLCSCDRSPAHVPTTTFVSEPTFQLELKPLTPLLPNRPTHPAIDPLGNVYWVQEADRSDDVLFVLGPDEVPRVTQLSAETISAALGASGGRGHIEDVVAGPGGEIYFYFYGESGRQALAAFGRYFPQTSKIQILADTPSLADASGMGLSLPLARGSLISDGRSIWLWLRHTDAWAMFRVDPAKLPAAGPSAPPRAFKTVTLNGSPMDLTRDEYSLSAGNDGNLLLVDLAAGRLLKIAPAGLATVVRSLIGFPSALSTATVDAKGQILLFAGNADPIKPARIEDIDQPAPPPIPYPAMLVLGDQHLTSIGRDDIIAYQGFPIFGMRLKQLLPNPSSAGWISYDAGSGELLRLSIKEKM